MFPVASQLLSLLLILATTVTGVAPAVGVCAGKNRERVATKCCGHCCAKVAETDRGCCSTSVQTTCNCAMEQDRPATPPQRQTSDERNDVRQAAGFIAVGSSADNTLAAARSAKAEALLASLPTPGRQVVLCRWLI